MHKFINKISQWLLPYTCVLCNAPSDLEKDICRACFQDLPWIKNGCKICANPLPFDQQNLRCGQCAQQSWAFEQTLAMFQYQYPINHWIISLKFHHHLLYAKILSALYADYIKKTYIQKNLPDVIIPMPLHVKRLKNRGFNQSLELARHLQKILKIPFNYKACRRIRYTETQSLITAEKRRNNVKNAFTCASEFTASYVAILDDVMTTGETVNALSGILKRQGVKRIDIWCIARAGIKNQ